MEQVSLRVAGQLQCDYTSETLATAGHVTSLSMLLLLPLGRALPDLDTVTALQLL